LSPDLQKGRQIRRQKSTIHDNSYYVNRAQSMPKLEPHFLRQAVPCPLASPYHGSKRKRAFLGLTLLALTYLIALMAPPYGVEVCCLFFKGSRLCARAPAPGWPAGVFRCLRAEPHPIIFLPASLRRSAAGSAQGTRRNVIYLKSGGGRVLRTKGNGGPRFFLRLNWQLKKKEQAGCWINQSAPPTSGRIRGLISNL
jgi:hypothetical protein